MTNGPRLVFLLAVLALALTAGTVSAVGGITCEDGFHPCSQYNYGLCTYTYDPVYDCCKRTAISPSNCIGLVCCN